MPALKSPNEIALKIFKDWFETPNTSGRSDILENLIAKAIEIERIKITELERQNQIMREALEFYANENNWTCEGELPLGDSLPIDLDRYGCAARQALKDAEPKEKIK